MSVNEAGRFAEEQARLFLKNHGFSVFQPDWIANKDGEYYLIEVKHQDRFEPPPFAGHGLPPYQVSMRLAFQKQTGIRVMLLIIDKSTKEWFVQWLDTLNEGISFLTQGQSPRKVFPIENFDMYPAVGQSRFQIVGERQKG